MSPEPRPGQGRHGRGAGDSDSGAPGTTTARGQGLEIRGNRISSLVTARKLLEGALPASETRRVGAADRQRDPGGRSSHTLSGTAARHTPRQQLQTLLKSSRGNSSAGHSPGKTIFFALTGSTHRRRTKAGAIVPRHLTWRTHVPPTCSAPRCG